MHVQGRILTYLLGISALLVESCAAFFSVYGLSKLFSGATVAVIIMAASLEVAKVIMASFLYRKWRSVNLLMKSYMIPALVTLVGITSMGIYGFLSNAFQTSTLSIEKLNGQLALYEDELNRALKDKELAQTEKREYQTSLANELKGFNVSDSARRYVDASYRARAVKRYQPMIDEKDKALTQLNNRIAALNASIADTKSHMIDVGSDVGPIIFVARALHAEISTVVQYLIVVFIFVFDPLAIVLVIAWNKSWVETHPVVLSKTKVEPIAVAPKVEPPQKVDTEKKSPEINPASPDTVVRVAIEEKSPQPHGMPPIIG